MAEQLTNLTKEWLKNDSEINRLKEMIKQRKEKNKILSEQLMDIMTQHDLTKFELKHETLIHSRQKVKQTISKKYLESMLKQYFINFPDQEIVKDLEEFLLNNRQEKIVESIKRKEKKSDD